MKIFDTKKTEVGILKIFRTKTEVKTLKILRTCNSREALTTTRSSPLVRMQNNLRRSLSFMALTLMSITASTLTTAVQENMETD